MSKVIGKTVVAGPGVGSTQTFMSIGNFETEKEAVNCDKYINTKFARAMLSMLKVTQHSAPQTWQFVPMQDFTDNSDINWNNPLPLIDFQLYVKYGLTDNEIAFIENNIEYRTDLPKEYGATWHVPQIDPDSAFVEKVGDKWVIKAIRN